MTNDKNIAVYICAGCGIAKSLDTNKLYNIINKEFKPNICKLDDCLCSNSFIDKINQDIQEHNINRIIIAACSLKIQSEKFCFNNYNNSLIIERANIREHVVWSHTPNNSETDDLALDYIRMAITKAKLTEKPIPYIIDINKTVLIIGAGIAGISAAIASAKAGYYVVLVEKEKELGGYYKKISKIYKPIYPFTELYDNDSDKLISEIENNSFITVYKSSVIEKISGQPGDFNAIINNNGNLINHKVGAIIQTTGWIPYQAEKLDFYGYGIYKDVITNIEMEDLLKNDSIKGKTNNQKINSIAFIQCAGSRDIQHLPYCSSICCMVTLKQALLISEKYPDIKIYIIYKDLRSHGFSEIFYKHVQNQDNIFITKGEIFQINEDDNNQIIIDIDDSFIDEKIQLAVDMLVLATGIVPTTKVLPELLEPEEKLETKDINPEKEKNKGVNIELGAKILNLDYRLGSDLPTLHYGFPDSHFICFPYETKRTGIYAAGAVRSPMDSNSAKNDAMGAALKAIQVIENTTLGRAVIPRAGDMSFPEFYFQRCTQCKRCTEECPFAALDEDEKGTPLPNPNRCRRCGICMGACPERIVSFKDYSVHIVSSIIKSIEVPEEDEEKPRILAFLCENDAYPALDIVAKEHIEYTPFVRVIPVRCIGSVNVSWIADALSAGFDGVILIGCKFGDDYQCHFITGSELANKRMENIQEKLKQMALEPERVEFHTLSIDEYNLLPKIFDNFVELIEEIGPNPFKDL